MILGLSAATAAVAATSAVSSFAWFAINDTVSATGMKIKADTDKYLEIRKVTSADGTAAKADWDDAVSVSYDTAKSLKPTTLAKSVTAVSPATTPATYSTFEAFTSNASWNGHKWLSTASDSVDTASKGTNKTYSDVTSLTDVVSYDTTNYGNNVYALVEEFDIRVRYLGDSTSTYTLNAKAEWVDKAGIVDGTSDKYNDGTNDWYLHNSARIFFVVGAMSTSGTHATAIADSDKGYILSSASSSEHTSGDWATDGVNLITDLKANNGTGTGGDSLGNGIRVRAYIYFDGADANCFSSAVLGNEYSINLKFSISD